MNLSLLYWASEEGEDPRFRHVANAHANMALEHMIRADGSTCHVAVFDPESGNCWSIRDGRAMPGFLLVERECVGAVRMANAYRYTNNKDFLYAAERVAHHFIASLQGTGCRHGTSGYRIPIPSLVTPPCAAIAASGLLELGRLDNPEVGAVYRTAAERIVLALSTGMQRFQVHEHEGILFAEPAISQRTPISMCR